MGGYLSKCEAGDARFSQQRKERDHKTKQYEANTCVVRTIGQHFTSGHPNSNSPILLPDISTESVRKNGLHVNCGTYMPDEEVEKLYQQEVQNEWKELNELDEPQDYDDPGLEYASQDPAKEVEANIRWKLHNGCRIASYEYNLADRAAASLLSRGDRK